MVFPTAGIEVSPWLPPAVSFAISFFTSMGGVTGAVLLLPFQVSVLGYVQPSVSATTHLYNIFAAPGGVWRYYKEGRLLWPLTWVIAAGALPGILAGAIVRVRYLPDPAKFRVFAGCVLLYTGVRLVRDLLSGPRGAAPAGADKPAEADGGGGPPPPVELARFDMRRLAYRYRGREYEVSFWGLFALSLAVGVAGGIYGIGGGAIIAPFLVAFFRLPVHTVAGAALLGTFITSVAGVASYSALAPYYPARSVSPDWRLGLLFGLGGLCGTYLGARCQRYASAKAIKWMLAAVIAFTGLNYLSALFM